MTEYPLVQDPTQPSPTQAALGDKKTETKKTETPGGGKNRETSSKDNSIPEALKASGIETKKQHKIKTTSILLPR